jgi:hypothetical protein
VLPHNQTADMSNNNDSPEPSNFFRRWWLWILGIGGATLGLLAWLAVNYEKVRTNIPLIYADLQYAKQAYWDAEEKRLQTNKDVATAPPSPPAQPPPSITTQSIPQVTAPCILHNPGRFWMCWLR